MSRIRPPKVATASTPAKIELFRINSEKPTGIIFFFVRRMPTNRGPPFCFIYGLFSTEQTIYEAKWWAPVGGHPSDEEKNYPCRLFRVYSKQFNFCWCAGSGNFRRPNA